MRTIELGSVKIAGADVPVKTALLEWISAAPAEKGNPQRGLDVAMMRRRIRLMDRVEAAGDELALEDADWAALRDVVDATEFRMADRGVLEICDRVLEAKAGD